MTTACGQQKKLIIEVALNEYVGRAEHPDVPLAVDEIAAQAEECAAAGASIIHFHPRPSDPKLPFHALCEDVDANMEIMKAIATRCDVITHPTHAPYEPEDRRSAFPHVRTLREQGPVPLETFVPFIGATSVGRWSTGRKAWVQDNVAGYSHGAIAEFLEWCQSTGLRPMFGVREVGHLRHIAAYWDLGLVTSPVLLHLGISASRPVGLPADAGGILTMLSHVPSEWNVEWFIQNNHDLMCADADDAERHRVLNVLAICMDGHVRTGIGDFPSWGTPQLRNVEMVEKFVEIAATVGREIASPQEAREMLALR